MRRGCVKLMRGTDFRMTCWKLKVMHYSMYMEEARKKRCGANWCARLLVLMVVGALRSSNRRRALGTSIQRGTAQRTTCLAWTARLTQTCRPSTPEPHLVSVSHDCAGGVSSCMTDYDTGNTALCRRVILDVAALTRLIWYTTTLSGSRFIIFVA
jgi:hypothetical protein